MERPAIEVADIFRRYGPAWREHQRGHLSLGQLKVMTAIERCRTPALGGHALRCDSCGAAQVAYNSCRNRHCPKCQASAAKRWLQERQAGPYLRKTSATSRAGRSTVGGATAAATSRWG